MSQLTNGPISVTLEPGTHFYCRCQLSKQFPLCDGSHTTTDEIPKKFIINDTQSTYLCGCAVTKNAPYCDGSHRKK